MKNWNSTKWVSESGRMVTIQEVLGKLQDEPLELLDINSIRHLSRVVIDDFRKKNADLSFPIIIVVEKGGQYQMILDGHHRLQKAIDKGHTHIYAKLFKGDIFSENKDKGEMLTYDQALEYLGVEDFWLDELLHTGTINSLSVEDLDDYLSNAPTEEIEN